MKSRQEIAIFSTSFLDLLSCGMGAVVLLCLVFAASKTMQGAVTGETTFLSFAVVSPVGPHGSPLIRVVADIDGTSIGPGETNVVKGTKVAVQPAELGSDSYQMIVTGSSLSSHDRVHVHLYDLNGIHGARLAPHGTVAVAEVVLKISRTGPGGTSDSEAKLTFARPSLSASLEGIDTASFDLKWE